MKFSWLIEEKVFERSETIRWRARIKPRILDLLSGTEWSFNGITISFRGGQAFKGDGSKGDESIDVLCGPTGNLEKKDSDILIINVLNKMTSQNMKDREREVFDIIMQTIYSKPEKPEREFVNRVSKLSKQITDILTDHSEELSEELSKVENRDTLMFIFVPEETVNLIKQNKNTSGTLESQLIRPLYEKLSDPKTEDTIKINLFDNKGDCYCFWSQG